MTHSKFGAYYAIGGTFSRIAQVPDYNLPPGFAKPVSKKDINDHMTLLDIADSKVIRAQNGTSGRSYEAWLDELVKADWQAKVEPTFIGVGYNANAKGQEAFYEVWEWPEVQAWRAALELDHKDLHVTFGIRGGDPHDVPKDRSTLVSYHRGVKQ